VPILSTSKSKITFVGKFNCHDERENEMMEIRWRTFELTKRISFEEQIHIIPCGKCFAKLVFLGEIIND